MALHHILTMVTRRHEIELITGLVGLVLVILGGYFIGTVFKTISKEAPSLEAGLILLVIGLVILTLIIPRMLRKKKTQ
jgi:membrane protein DedA with SNARE-associated domain